MTCQCSLLFWVRPAQNRTATLILRSLLNITSESTIRQLASQPSNSIICDRPLRSFEGQLSELVEATEFHQSFVGQTAGPEVESLESKDPDQIFDAVVRQIGDLQFLQRFRLLEFPEDFQIRFNRSETLQCRK